MLSLNGSSATEELSAFLFQTVPVKTGSTVILLLACLSLQDMLCQISVDLVPGSVLCHQSDTKILFSLNDCKQSFALPLSYCQSGRESGCVPVGRRARPFVFSYLDKEQQQE